MLVVMLFSVSNTAHAAVYKCEKGNVVEFSQFPCGKGAKEITVKEQNPSVSSNIVTHTEMDITGVDSYIRIKQINAEIQHHQDKIDTFTARMNEEIADLKNQSDAQLNNLSGTRKESAIAQQMANVSERYNMQIEREQRDLDRLLAEKKRLQSTSTLLKPDKNTDEIDRFIRSQQIKREIIDHQAKIDTYQMKMDEQIAVLEKQASEQPNNLTDVTFADSLSHKMNAITSRFNTLIEVEQRQIDRLLDEQTKIQ